jgi:hypothetical protein
MKVAQSSILFPERHTGETNCTTKECGAQDEIQCENPVKVFWIGGFHQPRWIGVRIGRPNDSPAHAHVRSQKKERGGD